MRDDAARPGSMAGSCKVIVYAHVKPLPSPEAAAKIGAHLRCMIRPGARDRPLLACPGSISAGQFVSFVVPPSRNRFQPAVVVVGQKTSRGDDERPKEEAITWGAANWKPG